MCADSYTFSDETSRRGKKTLFGASPEQTENTTFITGPCPPSNSSLPYHLPPIAITNYPDEHRPVDQAETTEGDPPLKQLAQTVDSGIIDRIQDLAITHNRTLIEACRYYFFDQVQGQAIGGFGTNIDRESFPSFQTTFGVENDCDADMNIVWGHRALYLMVAFHGSEQYGSLRTDLIKSGLPITLWKVLEGQERALNVRLLMDAENCLRNVSWDSLRDISAIQASYVLLLRDDLFLNRFLG
ncbi:hypothetical protein SISSUDRAFT_394372 [Sistotremastrum suecicum HHB10207 ss-3]|uniref:Uncharacterized protein n=1 Tax=Sistotremastrum suecicum HHB10207 ss-3 TaxID=1314776 RepID=A0A165YW45_9AGAM|nr:hypothetical protein SISSUDRAFT_394372 [Sistotremastrum suecicum HHB10207 ss-3]